jgi:hypothetical protein
MMLRVPCRTVVGEALEAEKFFAVITRSGTRVAVFPSVRGGARRDARERPPTALSAWFPRVTPDPRLINATQSRKPKGFSVIKAPQMAEDDTYLHELARPSIRIVSDCYAASTDAL